MKPVLEQVDLDDKRSIVAFRYSKEDFDAPWHFHPQHELTLIEESTGTKFIGDYVGTYESGELVLLRSNLPHCWKNHSSQDHKAESIVIQWNKGVFPKVPELHLLFQMLKTASKGLIFDLDDIAPLKIKVRNLIQLQGAHLFVALLDILVQLTACKYTTLSELSFRDDLPSKFGMRISKIQDFIATNYSKKIYLREVAVLVNMSEQSFSRFFSKMMGRPFFTYLNEYRINIASRMLMDTDWPVFQISYSCGYESLPFFYEQFNKFKGISPAKFRKIHTP